MSTRRDDEKGSLVGRVLLALAGVALIGFAMLFMKNGVWMYKTFDFRFGRSAIAYPASWIGLGILFFVLGAVQWSDWLERRNRRR